MENGNQGTRPGINGLTNYHLVANTMTGHMQSNCQMVNGVISMGMVTKIIDSWLSNGMYHRDKVHIYLFYFQKIASL
jgi:hypothetical protein